MTTPPEPKNKHAVALGKRNRGITRRYDEVERAKRAARGTANLKEYWRKRKANEENKTGL